MLTTSAGSASSLAVTSPEYLPKDCLVRTILVVHLETDLSEKFNLNLGYILTGAPDPDNQNDTLYRASYQKLMDTFRSDDFLTANSGDKLWGFVPGGTASGWWRIRADASLRLCLNEQRDCAGIGPFLYVVNDGMSDPWMCAH